MAEIEPDVGWTLVPHPDSPRLSRGIRRCIPLGRRMIGILYRMASVPRANREDLVAGVGSFVTGGRWNPPGVFHALYASLDESTALEEARQQNLRQGVPPWMALPLVLTAIEVDLEPVLDLVDGHTRRTLGVSRKRMLAESWWTEQELRREALTQAIGRLARDLGFVGLLVPSAARASRANMVIFPDRLAPPMRLAVLNADRLPPRMH